MRNVVLALVLVLTLLCYAPTACAQEARDAIVGRVTDRTGAVIPGASVKITNLSTGITMAAETNEQGAYQALYLIPALYRVAVEMQGFKSFLREGVELRVNDGLGLHITLEVGNLSELVMVRGETPLLETSSASIGQVVDARRIAELPTAHGNPYLPRQFASGTAFARTATGFYGTAYYSKMDPALTANLFFSNRIGRARGDFTYNRWGGTSSGPLILPKLYNGRSRTFYMWGFGPPDTNPYSGGFGAVQAESDYPRRIQFGLRFIY